jgi:hypothetical protein
VTRVDETRVVWLLVGLDAVAIWVTYSRLPASQLYNVSGTGFAAGAGRVLVDLNFPLALIAVGVVLVLWERLRSRAQQGLALASLALCAVVVWPGVVRQSDLDARAVNAVPAVGVGLALVLTFVAAPASWRRSAPGDRLRIAAGVVLAVIALPWIAAELGFFLNGVPGLGRVFLTAALRPEQPGLPPFSPAVHHGHHHGLDGVLFAVSSLLLSRRLPLRAPAAVRIAASVWLALMLAYGLGNIANDFWLEQVVKRGWTTWQVPSVLEPSLSVAWVLIVIGAAFVVAVAYRPGASPPASAPSSTLSGSR